MDFASVIDQVVKHSAPYTADRAGDLLFDVLTGLCPGHELRPDFSLVERSAHGEQATIVDRVEDLLAQLSWAADEEQRTFTCQLMSRLVICSHDLIDLADHPLMPGKMVDVVWLDVHLDRGTVFTTVPDAVLRSIRERIIASDGFSRYINSAQPERSIIHTLVLIVTVDGPSMQAPELMLVGPALVDESKGGLPLTGVISLGIGRVLRKGAPIAEQRQELDSRLRRLLQPFSSEVTDPTGFRRAFGVSVKDEKGLRDLLFKNMRDALQSLMQCMVDTRRVVEPSFAWAEGDPTHLREAATLVAYRLMFLLETQRRGLLLTGSSRGKATLLELVSQAGIDGEAPVAGKLAKGLLWYTRVMRGEYQADNVRLKGASIFANQPSDAFPDDTGLWAATFDAVEKLSTDEHGPLLKRWDSALARAGSVISGGLERAADSASGSEAALGLVGGGAEEHKQRILGDIYEQILAMVPQRTGDTDEVKLSVAGSDGSETNDRKKLGAHYTPASIVEEVVRAAMGPMFAHRWSQASEDGAGKARNYQASLRDLKVLDPAMGSGHFLTVAAVEIAREIAWVEVFGEPQPEDNFEVVTRPDPWTALSDRAWASDEDRESTTQMLHAIIRRELRGIVQGCCYGVDVSPLAVELGKLSLWLFTMSADDSPESVSLAFLDGNLLCGDSLTGMSWPEVKHELHTRLKGVNLDEQQFELGALGGLTPEQRQQRLQKLAALLRGDEATLRHELKAGGLRDVPIDHRSIDTLDGYALRKRAWEWVRGETAREEWLYDLATLAVFTNAGGRKDPDGDLRAFIREHGAQPELVEPTWENLVRHVHGGAATADIQRYHRAIHHAARHAPVVGGRKLLTMHYPLALPHVFINDEDGFDVVVGNPPFLGDRKIRTVLGSEKKEFLSNRLWSNNELRMRVSTIGQSKPAGTPDLCGYFVLLAFRVLKRQQSTISLVLVNTIVQGKNRGLLEQRMALVAPLAQLQRARQTQRWPEKAAVFFVLLTFTGLPLQGPGVCRLIDAKGYSIHRYGTSIPLSFDAHADNAKTDVASSETSSRSFRQLSSSESLPIFTGVFLRGASKSTLDFVHDHSVLTTVPEKERHVWKWYLNTEKLLGVTPAGNIQVAADLGSLDVANHPFLEAGRIEAVEEYAERVERELRKSFARTMALIDGVREERQALAATDEIRTRLLWWLYPRPRPEMMAVANGQSSFGAFPRIGRSWIGTRVLWRDAVSGLPTLPMDNVLVIATESTVLLGVCQSFGFEFIIRMMSSTLGAGMRVTQTKALRALALPFPIHIQWGRPVSRLDSNNDTLTAVGDSFDTIERLRSNAVSRLYPNDICESGSRPLSKLYSLYDSPATESIAIHELRDAHRRLQSAVNQAYGWTELDSMMKRDCGANEYGHPIVEGWTFDKPWIDGTWRYVPAARWRREMHKCLLQANEDRYWEEINLYLQNIPAELLPRARGGGRAVQTVKDITKLCKKAAFKITPADIEALWYEGERQGLWERGE
jgi:hypothetical protein